MSAATVAEFLSTFNGPDPDASRYPRIQACLDEAAGVIAAAIGWDFARHPATGDETRYFDGAWAGYWGGRSRRPDMIHVHAGIVSVTTLEYVDSLGGTYAPLAPTDFLLDPSNPEPGEPFDHIVLRPGGNLAAFPRWQRSVRVTGAFGYAAAPAIVKGGEIALARQIYRADATIPGGIIGPDEFSGGATIPRGWPDATYRVVDHYRRKFIGCRI